MSNWKTENYKASDLADLIEKKEIRVPPYQRGQVWKKSQEEQLVDSIKKGYPFGTLLLYKKDENHYQLIDGLQRSTTIAKYLRNPAKFYKDEDIDDESINNIYKFLSITGNEEKIKHNLKELIKDWVINNHKTMKDVKKMSYNNCARKITEEYPTGKNNVLDIADVLGNMFERFKEECEDFSNTEIPAIVYFGDSGSLPEVFSRINSKGTILSKYQILAATWTYQKYKIVNEELKDIVEYVNKFYTSLLDGAFEVDDFEISGQYTDKEINLYQLLFGFGKLLSNKYPYLFGQPKNGKDVESCGFNLVNACVGNRNSKISDLSTILKDCFQTDKEINDFLCNIIRATDEAYKYLKPYLIFKLNKRDDSIVIYHTEMQICSLISNIFNARYSSYKYDDNQNVIGRQILTDHSNSTYDEFKHKLKENCFKKYLIDILNKKWRGTGDRNLDEISLNQNYYTDYISRDMFNDELDHWFKQMNSERNEYLKVKAPGPAEKLLLSVIYSSSFTAYEQNNDINYDIEHLAPKGCLKMLLKQFNGNNIYSGLPISSFANLCLLREEENRKKKEKTLYQDDNYIKKINEMQISLDEIESKFSFTSKEDLDWVNQDYLDFTILKNNYYNFLNKRFEKQKEKILNNLFANEKKNLIHINMNDYPQVLNNYNMQSTVQHLKADTFETEILIPLLLNEDDSNINNLDGWDKAIFNIIDRLENSEFTLTDMYNYIDELSVLYPKNNSIDAKIRQILQHLRDKGLVAFVDRAHYKRLWK